MSLFAVNQGGPRGITGVSGRVRWHFIVPCKVYGPEPALAAATAIVKRRLPEEHEDATIWRPGRTFIEIAFSKEPFTCSIRAHDANEEAAIGHFRERDEIAAR